MEDFLRKITRLVSDGRLIISTHAAQEMADEQIDIADTQGRAGARFAGNITCEP
jgi:hypothetical protein